MYCPAIWHDNTSKQHSLEALQHSWMSIYEKTHLRNLKYKISFTGGEVTANKQFLPFIKWLKTNYSRDIVQILCTTNGSASLQYYKRLLHYVDNISFSIHSEHINETKLFGMIATLKHEIDAAKFLHVNIMNEFWNQDRINFYKQFLTQHEISHSTNIIDYSLQTREHPVFKGKLNFEI